MFSKILIATDFSESSKAALYAGLSLAKKGLTRVEVVHVVSYVEDMYNFSRFGIPDWDWQTGIRKKLDDFFPDQLYPNNKKSLAVGQSPTKELLKHARTEGCDLIVVGYHGHNALSNLLMGSVTQQLTRLSEFPVLVVKAAKDVEHKYQGFESVLVPSDFSDSSNKALGFGIKFANFLKADLHLIHVVDLPALKELQKNYSPSQVRVEESCELNVDSVLRQMLENKETIGETKVATLSGDPVDEIIRYSDQNKIDFIVMGTHGRKGLERVLMGSVTAGMLAKSDIPIMTLSYSQ